MSGLGEGAQERVDVLLADERDVSCPFVAAFDAEQRPRYPDYLLPIAGQLVPTNQRFADLREELLLNYGYQTARGYRADLDDIYDWATRRGFDVLALGERQIRQYVALLRRRKYSENTIRRRITALRRLYAHRPDVAETDT